MIVAVFVPGSLVGVPKVGVGNLQQLVFDSVGRLVDVTSGIRLGFGTLVYQ